MLHRSLKKKITRKIKKPTRKTKILASLASFFFIAALAFCAYLPAGLSGSLGVNDTGKSLTISRALANANIPSFIATIFVAYICLLYLLFVRGPIDWFIFRFFLLTLSFSLLVSLLWVTTTSNNELHYIFAALIFTSILFYNLVTFYVFFYSKNSDKTVLTFLIIFNIIVYLFLVIFAIFKGNPFDPDVFAAFEIFYALLFVCNVLFTGFY